MPKSNRSSKSTIITKLQLKKVCNSLPNKYSLLAECLYLTSNRMKDLGYTLKFHDYNIEIFLKAIKRIISRPPFVEVFYNLFLNNTGYIKHSLDMFNLDFWGHRSIHKKDKIKKIVNPMGY